MVPAREEEVRLGVEPIDSGEAGMQALQSVQIEAEVDQYRAWDFGPVGESGGAS